MNPRIIVLTGVTRGLGRAMAHAFIARRHTVLGCGRNAGQIGELKRAFGAPHDFQIVDVADGAAVQRWADSVVERHGAPDLLINNAAITVSPAPLWQVAEGDFARVIDVNI